MYHHNSYIHLVYSLVLCKQVLLLSVHNRDLFLKQFLYNYLHILYKCIYLSLLLYKLVLSLLHTYSYGLSYQQNHFYMYHHNSYIHLVYSLVQYKQVLLLSVHNRDLFQVDFLYNYLHILYKCIYLIPLLYKLIVSLIYTDIYGLLQLQIRYKYLHIHKYKF